MDTYTWVELLSIAHQNYGGFEFWRVTRLAGRPARSRLTNPDRARRYHVFSLMDFETFQHSHSSQLVNIPRTYWRALYEKLQVEVRKCNYMKIDIIIISFTLKLYDAGKYFCMSHGEDGWQVLVSCKEGLKLEDPSWQVIQCVGKGSSYQLTTL